MSDRSALSRGTRLICTVLLAVPALAAAAAPVPAAAAPAAPPAARTICTTGGGHSDPFSAASPAWHIRIPVRGPTVSLRGGCLILAVPAGTTYDAWAATDAVPEVLWTKLGPPATDWTATARLTLSGKESGGGLSAGLALRFDDAATQAQAPVQVFWGLVRGNPGDPPVLTAAATYNVGAYGSEIGRAAAVQDGPVTLRIGFSYEAGKCLYRFAYRSGDAGGFTTLPQTYGRCVPLAGVALFARTWGSPRAASAAFDWFDFSRAAAPQPCLPPAPGAAVPGLTAPWRAQVPVAGPRFSTAGTPGCLTLSVPADPKQGLYNVWAGTDRAAQLLRPAPWPALTDWTATTRLTLARASGYGGELDTGLVVRLDDSGSSVGSSQLFWGLAQSSPTAPLSLVAWTDYNNNAYGAVIGKVDGTPGTVTLRVGFSYEAGKCLYRFAYRTTEGAPFTTLPESYARCSPVDALGLFTATSGAPRAVSTQFNWFMLQQAQRLAPCVSGQSHSDGFNGKSTLAWQQRLPLPGPAFSLHSTAGCLAITTPLTPPVAVATDALGYGAWAGTDRVPELLLDQNRLPAAGWSATTRVTLGTIVGGGSVSAGLVVRLGDAKTTAGQTQIFWGLAQGGGSPMALQASTTYNFKPTGSQITQVNGVANTVILRITGEPVPVPGCPKNTGYNFSFAYALDGQRSFTAQPEVFQRCEGPASLGIFSSTGGRPRQTTSLFDWFDLRPGA